MTTFPMTIRGRSVSADSLQKITDPATGQIVGLAPECDLACLDDACEAACDACGQWAELDQAERSSFLIKAADAVEAHTDEIGELLTAEQGKPLSEARGENQGFARFLRYFAELDLPAELVQDDDSARVEVVRRPLGVVAALTPWNGPVYMMGMKVAPALAAGNTMVLKPSPFTPLATLRLGEILGDVLPAGVLNVVSGGNALGAALVSHAVPRKVSFTGSIATGRTIAQAAAADLKRVTLELGGNDPAVLLDDVDLERALPRIFWSAFGNCGQTCVAVKRVYVPASLYPAVIDGLSALAAGAQVGDGRDPETQIGPLTTSSQLERINDLVQDAVDRGGRVAAGGSRLDRSGNFYAPTIVADVSDGVRIVDEEQFGPALPIIAYSDIEHAVQRANATQYGLGASVWGSDPTRLSKVASRLEAGAVWVNTHRATVGPQQPVSGWKWSGLGVEKGHWGLEALTELRVNYVAHS